VRMKARLIELGKLQGAADSTFDEATAQALTDFQMDRGLLVTGLPDQQTLFQLLMKRP
jgi:peptidoglycan hydrolase-like protein with peptidoglycan-binding domain